jgi:hypothetical protein
MALQLVATGKPQQHPLLVGLDALSRTFTSRSPAAGGSVAKCRSFEAGTALDEAKSAVLEPVALAEHRVNLVERKSQRGVALGGPAIVVPSDDDEADDGASDNHPTQDQQEKRGDALDRRGR